MEKKTILEYFGSVSKTAIALNISHPAVSRWGEIIPEKQALRAEHITKGRLKYNPAFYEKSIETTWHK